MKLVIAATPSVALPTIEALKNSEHEIAHLITQPDKPAGRGRVLTPTPVGSKFECQKPNNENEISELLTGSDLLITIGYGRILSEKILNLPRLGGVNLHFSLLPKWRGAAPVQRSLQAGDKLTGVTVFQMDQGVDTGAIWVQQEFKIPDSYYASDLFESLAIVGRGAILETLNCIETGKPVPQTGAVSFASKISSEELRIDWGSTSVTIRNLIRGLGPNTYTTFRGEKILVSKVEFSTVKLPASEIAIIDRKLYVGTLDSALQISQVTPSGKRAMTGSDFVNGVRLRAGESFE
ncbi:MAG: hypothetical protein RLZ57_1107 [Actinomycetota bacterium]